MNRLRLFTAIALPTETVAEIERQADAFTNNLPAGVVRTVRPKNYHITLQFLGETDETSVPVIAAQLDAAVATIEAPGPFELGIQAIGAFPNARRPRTIWIGVGDPSGRLGRFARAAGRRLDAAGFESDRRELRPHVTIAYVKRHAGNAGVRAIANALSGQERLMERPFESNEIRLVSSVPGPGGSRYETLHASFL